MHSSSRTDSATRTASARIMFVVLGLPARPSRSMNTPAETSAARMATKASATRIFMTANYRPRRWWILAATIAGVALTARLGVWQLSRAQQKESLQAAIESRAALPPLATAALAHDAQENEGQLHRRAQLRGRWLAARTVFLDNRQMDGRPGFYVLTPLQLDGRPEAIVVQRGWGLPRAQRRARPRPSRR